MLADGRPADILDLNIRGLRRAEVRAASRAALKQAYKLLYRSNLNVSQALEAIEEEVEATPEVVHLVEFIKQIGEGGFGRAND
jgi:UDP-N-acetylglucosamine acyltransferase